MEEEKDEKDEKDEKVMESLYDPFKRDPQYCRAEVAPLWEIAGLVNHYHPTVQKYAKILLSTGYDGG